MTIAAAVVAGMLVARVLGPFGERPGPAERASSPVPTPDERPAPVTTPGVLPQVSAEMPRADAPAADAAPVLGVRDPGEVWRGRAARAVRDVAQEHFGRALDASEERRLVEALVGVRWAAGEGERDPYDPDDPEWSARERERSETILASDQTFRDLLGVGVAEFLRLLDAEQIEDLAPTPTPAG